MSPQDMEYIKQELKKLVPKKDQTKFESLLNPLLRGVLLENILNMFHEQIYIDDFKLFKDDLEEWIARKEREEEEE